MAWFDYPSNFSNGSSVTGINTLFQYVNVVTDNYFGGIILGLITLIVVLAGGTNRGSLTAGMFVGSIFSILFVALGLVNPIVSVTMIIVLIITVLSNAISNY